MTNINALNPVGTRRTEAGRAQSAGVAPGSVVPGVDERDARLRQVVGQLQGVFVEQLFKAMRETVPTDGITSGGAGEQMFAGMLDQHLANAVPTQWDHGLGESLLRQLRPQLALAGTTEGAKEVINAAPQVPR